MKQKIDWQEHIENWKTSGLSKIEYCRRNRLNQFSFYEKTRKTGSNGLIELSFISPHHITEKVPTFEIHFQIPFALRIRLNLISGKRS
jgi:hypothetical protein